MPRHSSLLPLVALAACFACGVVACSLAVSTDGLAGNGDPGTSSSDAGTDARPQVGTPIEGGPIAEGGDASDGTIQISAGRWHTCALANGRASCWGENDVGQLGSGTDGANRLSPTAVEGLPAGQVTAIGVGYRHSCAVVDGKVWCWGSSAAGGVGPNGDGAVTARPVEVSGLPDPAVDVQGGADFTCALLTSKRVYCWGSNDVGKLGDGTTVSHKAPTVVLDQNGLLGDVRSLGVGSDHSCVVKMSGEVWCWGHNDNGSLGNLGVGEVSEKAVPVVGLPGPAQSVSIAAWHACAIVAGGAWCWGSGNEGQLGTGGNTHSTTPVQPLGLASGVTLLRTAGSPELLDATCAVHNGQLTCWGSGFSFRLGDGQTASRATPNIMTTLPSPVTGLSGGDGHWCAQLANREVRCWGLGDDGQIGDGTGLTRALPVVVTGL